MSAVLKPAPISPFTLTQGATSDVLSQAAQIFLSELHYHFEPTRQALLAARCQHQSRFDAGELPDFRKDTCHIRDSDWRVAPLPAALLDRRVEITGPIDPKTVINALNSGANGYVADFEDATAPTWNNLIAGQRTLRQAINGNLSWDDHGTHYALCPASEQAVLMVRPRGWHLDEKHVLIDGERLAGALFDVGLFIFHNANTLAVRDRGPYLYLPKLQTMEEAQLWQDVLTYIEAALGLPEGQIKVTVLIETLPAAFEMDEILYVLRNRITGLNCGRWDYMFSYIKTLRTHTNRLLPERNQVTMNEPFLHTYTQLLIQTCHRRGVHAMGGMAAQIPINGDSQGNTEAMEEVRIDKLRQVKAGHDGTWVAHPALIAIARHVFDEHMSGPHQHHVGYETTIIGRDDLIKPCCGTVTQAGFENNVEVCVRYLAAWLDGNGCVPIHGLLEDASTAEISRVQLWQWLSCARRNQGRDCLYLCDGTAIDRALFNRTLRHLPLKLNGQTMMGANHLHEAIALLDEMTQRSTLEEFLTVPAYEKL